MADIDLTNSEADILIEALDAWVNKDLGGELMSTVLESLITKRDDEHAVAEAEQRAAARREKMLEAQKERQETSVMLKAKLIGHKRANAATLERLMA